MGKGKRNGRSTYRIVKHNKEFYERRRKLEARKKAMRNREIFIDGDAELELKVELNPNGGMPLILALPKKKKKPEGVKC